MEDQQLPAPTGELHVVRLSTAAQSLGRVLNLTVPEALGRLAGNLARMEHGLWLGRCGWGGPEEFLRPLPEGEAKRLLRQLASEALAGARDTLPLATHTWGISPGCLRALGQTLRGPEREALVALAERHQPDLRGIESENETVIDGRNNLRPKSRQSVQEELVLEALRALGYEPEALARSPKGMLGDPKSKCRERLFRQRGSIRWTDAIFEKAWDRLRKARRIIHAA